MRGLPNYEHIAELLGIPSASIAAVGPKHFFASELSVLWYTADAKRLWVNHPMQQRKNNPCCPTCKREFRRAA